MFYNQEKNNEYYVVKPGGLTMISLEQGDEVEINDLYGGQYCEFALYDKNGELKSDAVDLELPKKQLKFLEDKFCLKESDVVYKLNQLNIKISSFSGYQIFNHSSNTDESVNFCSLENNLILALTAAYQKMPLSASSPSTEVFVKIKRKNISQKSDFFKLPDPLSELRDEFIVDAKTAKSYIVSKDDYIQIIDLKGRQCSDFVAFSHSNLDKGSEDGIDITATRSVVGAAYPQPGLFSKYYNNDNQALVEVICDTVGRHDTFGLACTPKYYEDVGYPGHISCTENFNKQLKTYSIASRTGWPAVNLFYNTNIDCHNQIFTDEPWSRAGDFVLFKAHRDLLCASSACPDDLGPANGWNPTDILVRVYKGKKKIASSQGYRVNPKSPLRLTQRSGFYPKISKLTGNFTEYNGFWMPTHYNNYGAIKEYWGCRQKVAMIDLSPLRKFEVCGKDAETLMNRSFTRNVKKLVDNQVVYSALCYPTGGMLDEGTIFKFNNQHFRWIGGCDYSGEFLKQKAQEWQLAVQIKPSTNEMHNIAVQGPLSRELLQKIIYTAPEQTTLEKLGWFRFTLGNLENEKGIPLLVSRTGFTGELGFEIFCHPENALILWDKVVEAGAEFSIIPMGFDALDMLRIEAGLIVAGNEYCDRTDPFEAGIGFTVPLKSKEEDFTGKATLKIRKENPQRKLIGIELEGREHLVSGDLIFENRFTIGSITSSNYSPYKDKIIGYALMDINYCDVGRKVEIGKLDGLQKRLAATLTEFPVYDPQKTRVRA